jgi:hypothetical protein
MLYVYHGTISVDLGNINYIQQKGLELGRRVTSRNQ